MYTVAALRGLLNGAESGWGVVVAETIDGVPAWSKMIRLTVDGARLRTEPFTWRPDETVHVRRVYVRTPSGMELDTAVRSVIVEGPGDCLDAHGGLWWEVGAA
jgi:hypothetical protein